MKTIPDFPIYEKNISIILEDNGEPLENFRWYPQILTLDQLYAIKFLVNKSIKMIKVMDVDKINNDRLLSIREGINKPSKKIKSASERITNLYLMIDTSCNAVKIGRSDKPKCRESTLQAEKPSIKLVFSIPAPLSYEKVIQNHFSKFRLRGEWFNVEVNTVIDYINSNPPVYGKV